MATMNDLAAAAAAPGCRLLALLNTPGVAQGRIDAAIRDLQRHQQADLTPVRPPSPSSRPDWIRPR